VRKEGIKGEILSKSSLTAGFGEPKNYNRRRREVLNSQVGRFSHWSVNKK
jgi:hypothetical protein